MTGRRRAMLTTLATLTVGGCKSDRDLFEQTNTDGWAQAPTDQVDILFVVDDSTSMIDEQETLASGFASFASQLESSGTDFHLGVITTSFRYDDPDRGRLLGDPPILTASDDYEAAFTERAIVGLGGSDKEKGLEAAAFAVHPSMTLPGAPNEGFVRRDAALLVVAVSDEDDCSDAGALEGQSPTACYEQDSALTPVVELVSSLQALKDDPALVTVGAIVAPKGPTCPDAYFGSRYIAAALLTGGKSGDICQTDWSGMLEEFGVTATGIRTAFQTTEAAKPETIVVHVDDVEVAQDEVDGWTYDTSTWFLEFHGAGIPPRGSLVTATYTVQPGVSEPEVAGTTTP
ncbi:MAG: hypothetical protein R3F59_16025 [Myxococcota bacterium]